MQAIILAAGRGTRLGREIPKGLIEVGGETLVGRWLRMLHREGIADIALITGYEAELFHSSFGNSGVHFIENPFYSWTETLGSFWCAQSWLQGDFIFAHADLVVGDDLFRRLLETHADAVLPYDSSTIDAESMKIARHPGGWLQLSKDLDPTQTLGESIPLMCFSSRTLKHLFNYAEKAFTAGCWCEPFDSAAASLSEIRELSVELLDATGMRWAEVDTEADLISLKEKFR